MIVYYICGGPDECDFTHELYKILMKLFPKSYKFRMFFYMFTSVILNVKKGGVKMVL